MTRQQLSMHASFSFGFCTSLIAFSSAIAVSQSSFFLCEYACDHTHTCTFTGAHAPVRLSYAQVFHCDEREPALLLGKRHIALVGIAIGVHLRGQGCDDKHDARDRTHQKFAQRRKELCLRPTRHQCDLRDLSPEHTTRVRHRNLLRRSTRHQFAHDTRQLMPRHTSQHARSIGLCDAAHRHVTFAHAQAHTRARTAGSVASCSSSAPSSLAGAGGAANDDDHD
jgi:hypothetical protein